MKTLKLIVSGMILLLASAGQAQVSENINIGSPPKWGPAGHDEVRYYYLPDVQAYYDVPSSMFIYNRWGNWIQRAHLSSKNKNYDLYRGYKVAMTDYRGDTPYIFFKEHKKKYAKGYQGPPQKNIGEKSGNGNSDPKSNPSGNSDTKSNSNRNSNNNKQGNGNGNGKKK